MRMPAFTQELVLEEGAVLALAVSVFAGDFVSAGADLPSESVDLDSLLKELPEELSDELLPELLFDA
jgi:hypothetical protein